MNEYPPGNYIVGAMQALPAPAANLAPQTIEVDARPYWGRYRLTFIVKASVQEEMPDYWFWELESSKRINGAKGSAPSVAVATPASGLRRPVAYLWPEQHPAASGETSMTMTSSRAKGRRPPSNYLAAAIKQLPTPGPDVSPQVVQIELSGRSKVRYEVTFVPRWNARLKTLAWYWGLQSSRRMPLEQADGE